MSIVNSMMKKILFITSTRIGDAVLSTGILSYILKTYPDAQITIACGSLVEDLFQGVLGIDRIPSAERLRQRLDEAGADLVPSIVGCSRTMLKRLKVKICGSIKNLCPWTWMCFPKTIPIPARKA